MTLCVTWRRNLPTIGLQVLLATDSMITGGFDYSYGAKLFPFARNDCAMCWEGEAFFPYTMISNIRNDIDYSDFLSGSAVDILAVAERSLTIINQLWRANLDDLNSCCKDDSFSFLFAGYSYRLQQVKAWHITRTQLRELFELREIDLANPYFIGDGAVLARKTLAQNAEMLPQQVLQSVIENTDVREVGGKPQFLSIDRRGVEVIGIYVNGTRYLFGKELHSSGHLSKVRYISDVSKI
jgi:hypothetical protein